MRTMLATQVFVTTSAPEGGSILDVSSANRKSSTRQFENRPLRM